MYISHDDIIKILKTNQPEYVRYFNIHLIRKNIAEWRIQFVWIDV